MKSTFQLIDIINFNNKIITLIKTKIKFEITIYYIYNQNKKIINKVILFK
jgi:hypothetical protein